MSNVERPEFYGRLHPFDAFRSVFPQPKEATMLMTDRGMVRGNCEAVAPAQPFDVLVRRSHTDDKAEAGSSNEKAPYSDGITFRIIDNSPQRAMRKALAFAGGVMGPWDLYAEVV